MLYSLTLTKLSKMDVTKTRNGEWGMVVSGNTKKIKLESPQ